MRKLLIFEARPLKRSVSLLSLNLIVCMIAILGWGLTSVFSGSGGRTGGEGALMSFYNAFAQFTFLVLGVFYAYTFAKDFGRGTYTYYEQVGFGLSCVIGARAAVLMAMSALPIVLIYVVFVVFGGGGSIPLVLFVIMSVMLMVVFVLLLSALLAILFKEPLFAVLAIITLFLSFSLVNYFFYGLTNQADTSSLTSFVVGRMVGLQSADYQSLSSLKIDWDVWGMPVSLLLSVTWILLVGAVLVDVIKHTRTTRQIRWRKSRIWEN